MIRCLVSVIACLLTLTASANNVKLDSLELKDSLTVSMHLSWENSWNMSSGGQGNHDAAWIFLKVKRSGGWQHLDISSDPTHYSIIDTTLEVITVNDQKGIFVRRKQTGSGMNETKITMRLKDHLTPGTYDLRAFAVEMVYVPEAAFYIGDSVSNNAFRNAGTHGPFRISSEAMISVDSSGQALDNRGDFPPAADIPADYPKGFSGFYMMKYEISQEQYVDFLNTLSYSQQASRTAASPSSTAGSYVMNSTLTQLNRNSISIRFTGSPAVYSVNADNDQVFNDETDGANRACNFLSWQDLSAYLDWACLRPFTEFEYEKACRGSAYPVPLEFAWGTDKVMDANTLVSDASGSETVSEKGDSITGVASHGYSGPSGPIRCGFNGSATSTRTETGASYYGIMELSGNLWEQCVGVNTTGLNFKNVNGDGQLSSTGNSDVTGWDNSANGVSIRGGGWNSGIQPGFRDLAVSERFYGSFNTSMRRGTTGGRGCRTH